MKKIAKLTEEIIPLSRKQSFFLFIVISCFFQFALFYTPALAEDAVNRVNKENGTQGDILITINMNRSAVFFPEKETSNSELLNLFSIDDIKKFDNAEITKDIFDDQENTNFLNKKITFIKEEPRQPEVVVVSSGIHVMTAYNSEVAQTDDTPCITANGFDVCAHGIEDTIAANFLPFGTKVRIPDLFGDRIFVVRDRMNKRYPDRADVWMLSKADALKFGVRRTRIEVVKIIEPEVIEKEKRKLISLS